jgi:hypothetical protein
MHSKQRKLQCTLTWLVLGLAVPAWAQTARVDGMGQSQPEALLQVTQTPTVAVCGDSCDCGGTGVAKESAPCTVRSSTGSCTVGSGECCVCAAANTVAVCGDTCDCSSGSLLTKVSAPCDVTSSVGSCNIGSGECCVCTTN